MRTVAVTGGAGYIGRAVAAQLKDAGLTCITVDNLSTGYPDWVDEQLDVLDIRDTERLTRCLVDNCVDAVVHLAALKSPAESISNPSLYHAVNTLGTQSVLDAVTAAGVGKVVFSSSSAVYGDASGLIAEASQCHPKNPYGESKVAGELIGRHWESQTGGSFVALRYFNVGGADQELRYGERHRGRPSQIIPAAIESAMNSQPVHVFGLDYATADGSAVRDFVHVDDIARAHVVALSRESTPGVFNLGTGQGNTVLQVVAAVEAESGVTVQTLAAGRRPGDPESSVCDVKLARERLGWDAEHDLASIVASAWKWRRALVNAGPADEV